MQRTAFNLKKEGWISRRSRGFRGCACQRYLRHLRETN